MEKVRTYGETCSAAHALDLVGDRWALLVVRELLLGPKRFSDLRAGVLHGSAALVSQRLRELEARGIVRRRKLGPPTSAVAYELTEWGAELEPVLVQLARWGARSPMRDLTAGSSVDAVMLALRSQFDPEADRDFAGTIAVVIGDHEFTVRVHDHALHVTRGRTDTHDATLRADLATLAAALAAGRLPRPAANSVTVDGDAAIVDRLLASLAIPSLAPVPEA